MNRVIHKLGAVKIAAGSETAETTFSPSLVQRSEVNLPAEAALLKRLTQPRRWANLRDSIHIRTDDGRVVVLGGRLPSRVLNRVRNRPNAKCSLLARMPSEGAAARPQGQPAS